MQQGLGWSGIVFVPVQNLPIPPFELKTLLFADDNSWRAVDDSCAVNISLTVRKK
jgi:hypothetical protein